MMLLYFTAEPKRRTPGSSGNYHGASVGALPGRTDRLPRRSLHVPAAASRDRPRYLERGGGRGHKERARGENSHVIELAA